MSFLKSPTDNLKLQELADLLMELEIAKEEGYLPGLGYLDIARGIQPIVEKLPYKISGSLLGCSTKRITVLLFHLSHIFPNLSVTKPGQETTQVLHLYCAAPALPRRDLRNKAAERRFLWERQGWRANLPTTPASQGGNRKTRRNIALSTKNLTLSVSAVASEVSHSMNV